MKPAYDSKGIPMEPGDVLRSFHFSTKRKNFYLYHVVCIHNDCLRAVPAFRLAQIEDKGGEMYLIGHVELFTIVQERPRFENGRCVNRKRVRDLPAPDKV